MHTLKKSRPWLLLWGLLGLNEFTLAQTNKVDTGSQQRAASPPVPTETLLPTPEGLVGRGSGFAIVMAADGDTALLTANISEYGYSQVFAFEYDGAQWQQQQILTPATQEVGDAFGGALALHGDRAVIGAYYSDSIASEAGAVYVYERINGLWTQQQKLTADDAAAGDGFGSSVAMSDDQILIGAWETDQGGTDNGSVYVFEHNGTLWTQVQKFAPDDLKTYNKFGSSMSLFNDRLIVSAPVQEVHEVSEAGAVYLYQNSPSGWQLQEKWLSSESNANDRFGSVLLLTEDMAMVASVYRNFSTFDEGAVYVFEPGEHHWQQTAVLQASDAHPTNRFGRSMAMFEGDIVIGSTNDLMGINTGAVYRFARIQGQWQEVQQIFTPNPQEHDQFSTAMHSTGEQLLISGMQSISGYSGRVHVYQPGSSGLTETAEFIANEGANYGAFGSRMHARENRLIVGAPRDNGLGVESGAAYIYEHNGATWSLQQKLHADNAEETHRFGSGIAINGDTAAVGAPGDGSFGPYDGQVYVFNRTDNQWLQTDRLTPTRDSQAFGIAIALDGDHMAIGANIDDWIGSNAGAVFMAQRVDDSWVLTEELSYIGAGEGDHFGSVLEMNGPDLLAGSSNAIHHYRWNGSSWAFQQTITAPPVYINFGFGSVLDLHGSKFIVGTPYHANQDGLAIGAAFIYHYTGTEWVYQAQLLAPDPTVSSQFGSSVLLSDDLVLIGAPRSYDIALYSGAVYAFKPSGDQWLPIKRFKQANPLYSDNFGSTLAMSQNFTLVGTPNDDDHGTNSGSVSVYKNIDDLIFFGAFETVEDS